MLKNKTNNSLLKRMILIVSVFLISFFSLKVNTGAASFKYSDFDFDEFAKLNKGYWTRDCAGDTDEENCNEKMLESQREFYTRLYKILAKYERKGVKFNENSDLIIIATVYFNLSLDLFSDNGEKYKKLYGTDKSAYNYDSGENIDSYDPDNDDESLAAYFANETDTLKLLIKSMIGYRSTCIGYKEGTFETRTITETNEDGTVTSKEEEFLVCDLGTPTNNLSDHEVCAATVSTNLVGAWEKFTSNINFFGLKSNGTNDCINEVSNAGFSNAKYSVDSTKVVDENYYWQFLADGNYFDTKPHLQYYYAKVLNKSGYSSMTEFYDNATAEILKEYDEEIKKARNNIIDYIKKILKDYNGYSINGSVTNLSSTTSNSYWWPIGSVETTEDNGKIFATGEPETSSIYRNYGMSRDDVLNEYNNNYGIDIIANDTVGATNIIAVSNGTVSEVENSCKSNDDKECGGGYGNYVIITHAGGNQTLYAHLHEGTITVNVGDAVSQGEVIGKMGASGKTTRTMLHFEIRTGSSKASAVDPNNYVSIENSRPTNASGDLVNMLLGLEGTGPISGDNYVVYCNTADVPTVGPGITLTYNYDKFAKYGYSLNSSGGFNSYCGKTFPINVIDQIFGEVLIEKSDSIRMTLASAGINLNVNQIDALTSLKYNCGNIDGFVNAYNIYGSSESLCSNWWLNKASGGYYASTLKKRRQKECNLFVNGIYDGTYS